MNSGFVVVGSGFFRFADHSIRRRADPYDTGQIGAIRARRVREPFSRSSFLRSSFRLTRKDRRRFDGVCLGRRTVCLGRRAHNVATLSRNDYETRPFSPFFVVSVAVWGARLRMLRDTSFRSLPVPVPTI